MPLNEYDELLTTGQAPAANEYDALLADERDLQKTALRQSLHAATATPPDTAARALEYAEQLNLPRGTVERNLDAIERRAAVERNDYDRLLDEQPTLSAWLSESPDNAAVARDDIERLGVFERLLNSLKRGTRSALQSESALKTSLLADRIAAIEALNKLEDAGIDVLPTSAVLGVSELTPDQQRATQYPEFRRLSRAERDEVLVGLRESVGRHVGDIAADQQKLDKIPLDPQVAQAHSDGTLATWFYYFSQNPANYILQIGAQSLPAAVPSLALGAVAGPAGFGIGSYAQDYGASFVDALREEGVDVTDRAQVEAAVANPELIQRAMRRAAQHAGPVAALDTVSAGVASKVLAPARLATRPVARELTNVAAQAPIQGALGAAGETAGQVTQGKELNAADIAAEFVGEFVTTPADVGALAINRGRARVREIIAAKERQDLFTALGQSAEASKLRERLPGKLQEFVARATADGPVENVYIPVEAFATYFQGAATDPRTVATELLGNADAYDAALRTGEDLKIPTAAYAAKLAGTPHHKALAPDLKLSPEEMTAREAEALVESLKQQAASPDEVSNTGAGQSVREDVLGQLLGIGYERATAEAYAELYESTFRTLGQRAGVDPFALYQRYGLKIERPLPEVLRKLGSTDAVDVLIDRLRKGDIPSDRDVYGPSLLDFLVEQGGLQDQGGELSARDAAKARRGLVRDTGRTFDDAAEIAVEAGYLAERDPNLLLEAIGSELRGQRVNAPERGNAEAQNVRATLEQLDEYLRQLGVDIKTAENPVIKQLLRAETETPAAREFQQRTPDTQRGAIRIGPEREISIRLLERADLSTFLHETGHFYLEVLGDLATGELATGQPAPADLVRDYQAILDWLGVKSRDQIKVEHHEQFARGFEAYLREGKAPSAGLRTAFAKFRAWLVAIYRSIARLDVKLTDEVRGVMDRLLATEEEIAAAQAEGEVVALFNDAASAGMTDAEFVAYRQTVETANVAARERLQTSLLAQVKREQSAAYQAERAKMRETVGREVDQQPGYRAAALLAKGTLPDGSPLPEGARAFKLDRKAIVAAYGKDLAAKLRAYTAAPDDATPTLASDQAAEALGYNTGEDLLMALVNLRPREALIDAEADVRLREQHGDLMLDGTKLAAEAQRSLHGDERAKVIAAELAALRRQQRQARPFVRAEQQKQAAERRAGVSLLRGSTLPIAQIRAIAEGMIAQRRVREIQPGTYLVAMRRAARQAVEAAGKGEYDVAAAAKQRELLNLELYRAARDALDDTETIADYLGKFTKDKARAKLGKAGADYLEQVDGLLERFEFKRVTGRSLDQRAALAQWIADKQTAGDTAGEEFVVPDRLLDEAYRVNYRQLTVDELRGLRDAVKQIEHFARLKNKLLAGAKEQERDAAKAELLVAIEANLNDRGPPPLTKAALSRIEKLGRGVAAFDASLLKMEQLVDWLDGDDINGPWHRYLWDGAAAAQTAELDYSKRITTKIAHAVMNIPKPIRVRMLERVAIPGVDRAVTRKDLIGVALNVGNASNYDKLLKGMGWTPEQVQGMVDRLTPDEIGFVNQLHATLESMWPDIAKLQKELTGLEPDKVEARAFPAKGGTIAGGYYPILYDPLASQQGQLQLASRVGGLLEDSYTRATTPKGHTKSRVAGFAAPFNLDVDDLTGHVAGVVKDLTHRKWLLDANWLVHDREIRAALRRHLGDVYVGLFPDWVRSVVNDRNFGSLRSLNIWRRGVEHLRYNIMIASMGFKASTMTSQLAGLGPAIEAVGTKYLKRGFVQFVSRPVSSYRMVTELSGEMRHRLDTRDRDLRDKLRLLEGREDFLAKVQDTALRGIAWADMMVSIPTWLGAYQKAIGEGLDVDTAVKAGDRAVRLSQGSGGAKDLAAVMARNDTLMRLITMFYTPFNALYNRLRDIGHDVKGVGDVPRAALRLWWVWLVPAVMGEILAGRPPDDDEEPDAWAIKAIALYPTLAVPFVRDVAGGAFGDFGYQLSPVAQVGTSVATTIKKANGVAAGDEGIDALAKSAMKTTGYLVGLPTGQLQITGGYLFDLSTGDADPEDLGEFAHDLLYRRRN